MGGVLNRHEGRDPTRGGGRCRQDLDHTSIKPSTTEGTQKRGVGTVLVLKLRSGRRTETSSTTPFRPGTEGSGSTPSPKADTPGARRGTPNPHPRLGLVEEGCGEGSGPVDPGRKTPYDLLGCRRSGSDRESTGAWVGCYREWGRRDVGDETGMPRGRTRNSWG